MTTTTATTITITIATKTATISNNKKCTHSEKKKQNGWNRKWKKKNTNYNLYGIILFQRRVNRPLEYDAAWSRGIRTCIMHPKHERWRYKTKKKTNKLKFNFYTLKNYKLQQRQQNEMNGAPQNKSYRTLYPNGLYKPWNSLKKPNKRWQTILKNGTNKTKQNNKKKTTETTTISPIITRKIA